MRSSLRRVYGGHAIRCLPWGSVTEVSGATTCSGPSPTGARLAYDNQCQLAQWLSAPTNPASSARYLYDGEGNRVQQAVIAALVIWLDS